MEIIQKDHVQMLRWEQDVTLKNVDDFRKAVWELLDCDGSKQILELAGVVYLNSAALGVIADAFLSAKRSNKELVVAGVQPTVEEIFNIVRFGTFIKIFVEVEEAFTYYRSVVE